MDVIAYAIELKPNSLDRVESWARTLNERADEAIATHRDEGIMLESWFHLSLGGKDYLLCYIRAESIARAQEVFESSSHTIDAYHKQFKDDVSVTNNAARLLVDLVNDSA